MTLTSILVLIVLSAMLLFVKRGNQVSLRAAQEHLRNGALIIDVRSAGEFTARHLPRAINIPLSEIEPVVARKVNGKDQVLLLHCQSGVRSAQARKKLRALGYRNTYNLGSYRRAAQIMGVKAA